MKLVAQIFSFLLLNQCLYSQAFEQFHFSLPETRVSNSKYDSIEFLDSRLDTSSFGKVYSNHYKRKVPLVHKVNMRTQLNWLIQAAIDTSALDGKLLFQFRKFEIVELGGEIPDYGYCPVRADLYVKKNSNYFLLARIDTFLATEKGIGHIDVTEFLIKQSKETLSRFVLQNLQKEPAFIKAYSYEQLLAIDSIEKTHLPLYTTQNYVTGIYLSYASFKIQKPDYTLLKVTRNFDEIQSLTLLDKKGKTLKINYKEVYAFVYKDTAYISDYYGCYALKKMKNDFYFIGKGKTLPSEEDVALTRTMSGVLAGPIGGFVGSKYSNNNAFAFYYAKLDHYDGSVIWYNKIK